MKVFPFHLFFFPLCALFSSFLCICLHFYRELILACIDAKYTFIFIEKVNFLLSCKSKLHDIPHASCIYKKVACMYIGTAWKSFMLPSRIPGCRRRGNDELGIILFF